MRIHLKVVLFCAVVTLVWVCHYVFDPFGNDEQASFNILDRSLSLRKVVTCMDISPGYMCLRRFRAGIIRDVFEEQLSFAGARSLNRYVNGGSIEYFLILTNDLRCFNKILPKSDTVILLHVAECLYNTKLSLEEESTADPRVDKRGSGWLINVASIVFLLGVPITGMFLKKTNEEDDEQQVFTADEPEMHQDPAQQLTRPTLSSSSELAVQSGKERRIVARFGDECFDLTDKSDLERWRNRFKRHETPSSDKDQITDEQQCHSSLVIDLDSPDDEEDLAGTTGPSTGTSSNNPIALPLPHSQKGVTLEQKDEESLVPLSSVLTHRTTTKDGTRMLRRVFIPGRGWMNRRVLALERQRLMELIRSPNPRPKLCVRGMN